MEQLKLLAGIGNDEAQYKLGVYYQKPTTRNLDEALKYYKLASEQHNCKAQYNLGRMYEAGVGVDKDYDEAIKYYKLASEQKYGYAQTALKRLETSPEYTTHLLKTQINNNIMLKKDVDELKDIVLELHDMVKYAYGGQVSLDAEKSFKESSPLITFEEL